MKFRRQTLRSPTINVTPMLDAVFLLLLFFAVSTSFRHGSQLDLTLPTAQGTKVKQQQHPVVVSITAAGQYSINGEPLSKSNRKTLAALLNKLAASEGSSVANIPLLIRADAKATHQAVVTVMDVAGKAGFVKVGIDTIKPKGEG